MYYTYAYLRKKDGTPYYIGKGCGNRAYKRSKKDIKSPKDKSRIIILKNNLTEEEAFKHEIYMIVVFGRKDLGTGILYNRTDGGEGISGTILSEETKQKMSESRKGHKNHFYGRKHSAESIEKMKISLQGKTPWNKNKHLPDTSVSPHALYMRNYRKGKTKINKNREFISPNGEKIIILDLKTYCKDNGLTYQSMLKLYKGVIKQHKGWRTP